MLLSGLTDVADGFIARQFHMGSKLGEVLDPVADKLTQGGHAADSSGMAGYSHGDIRGSDFRLRGSGFRFLVP